MPGPLPPPGTYALYDLRALMKSHPEGRKILEEEPIINSSTVDFEALRKLPSNTFGNAYMKYMDENG